MRWSILYITPSLLGRYRGCRGNCTNYCHGHAQRAEGTTAQSLHDGSADSESESHLRTECPSSHSYLSVSTECTEHTSRKFNTTLMFLFKFIRSLGGYLRYLNQLRWGVQADVYPTRENGVERPEVTCVHHPEGCYILVYGQLLNQL